MKSRDTSVAELAQKLHVKPAHPLPLRRAERRVAHKRKRVLNA